MDLTAKKIPACPIALPQRFCGICPSLPYSVMYFTASSDSLMERSCLCGGCGTSFQVSARPGRQIAIPKHGSPLELLTPVSTGLLDLKPWDFVFSAQILRAGGIGRWQPKTRPARVLLSLVVFHAGHWVSNSTYRTYRSRRENGAATSYGLAHKGAPLSLLQDCLGWCGAAGELTILTSKGGRPAVLWRAKREEAHRGGDGGRFTEEQLLVAWESLEASGC